MSIRPALITPVSLRELFPSANSDAAIMGATLDSRAVRPGWLYAALPGTRTHGAKFVPQAVEAGAAAVLTDLEGASLIGDTSIPVIALEDVRQALGPTAARIFGHPTKMLKAFGVTGTNGKTTTTALLAAGLRGAGRSVGTIGTIGFHLDGTEIESARSTVTTPEAIDLQALLAVMVERGADAVALEVSSHALEYGRADGIEFEATGFLNLGHDHLDFHKTVEAYGNAKSKLFLPGRSKVAVFWVDDPFGRVLAEQTKSHTRTVTVGTSDADYMLSDVRASGRLGSKATITRGGHSLEMKIALPGLPNTIDAAVAFAMLESAGVDSDAVLDGLSRAQVPGRMERAVFDPEAPLIVVDFAHTPQAVQGAIDSLAKIGPVTTVLGCGGDRDAEKRPKMGQVAAERSEFVVVTDDNPRTEDPAAIRAAVMEGAVGRGAEVEEVDGRAEAIALAISRTPSNGVVAILGKGHERGQIIGDRVIEFDDVAVAQDAWQRVKESRA